MVIITVHRLKQRDRPSWKEVRRSEVLWKITMPKTMNKRKLKQDFHQGWIFLSFALDEWAPHGFTRNAAYRYKRYLAWRGYDICHRFEAKRCLQNKSRAAIPNSRSNKARTNISNKQSANIAKMREVGSRPRRLRQNKKRPSKRSFWSKRRVSEG